MDEKESIYGCGHGNFAGCKLVKFGFRSHPRIFHLHMNRGLYVNVMYHKICASEIGVYVSSLNLGSSPLSCQHEMNCEH